MKTKLFLPLIALAFLVLAVISGITVSRKISIDTFQHMEAFGSGFQRLRHFIASALYLQLDDYHHIEMYQGIPWDSVTDYLPQMWLIARLDPNFTDVYTDAAYHLAINLGKVQEGIGFIREGIQNNPDNLDIRFELAYLLWDTETGTTEDIINAILEYRTLLRAAGGDSDHAYNEPSSATILAELYESNADLTAAYGQFYRRRALFIREAIQSGLYYTNQAVQLPAYLSIETDTGMQ